MVVALSSLCVALGEFVVNSGEAAKAIPQIEGAVWRGIIDIDLEQAGSAVDSPNQLLNVFQLSNTGRDSTTLIGAKVENLQSPGSWFQSVDGMGKEITPWNTPIVIAGGESVLVAVRIVAWPDVCDIDKIASCPPMTLEFSNGVSISVTDYLMEDACYTSNPDRSRCQLLARVAHKTIDMELLTHDWCIELVTEIDRRSGRYVREPRESADERKDQLCSAYPN